MSVWDAYPHDYRSKEVRAILSAVQAGECAALVGLSGAGKSNLLGFLANRLQPEKPAFFLVDGNRVQPPTAEGLLRLIAYTLDGEAARDVPLEQVVAQKLAELPGGVCLLFDRFDVLSEEERARAGGPLRALRDRFKYQLTYVIAARRPPDLAGELAELFYAHTLWLGPLAGADARWSARQYMLRRGQSWDDALVDRLVALSWGYPALLRACCEAAADLLAEGAPVEDERLREHPAVQRRVQEFWADRPSPEDLQRSGLAGQPLLAVREPAGADQPPDLTASEYRLLCYFQAHPGEVCGKDDLIRAVWPEERVIDGLRDDSLAQLIRRLRQKIGAQHIQTIPGRGYRGMFD